MKVSNAPFYFMLAFFVLSLSILALEGMGFNLPQNDHPTITATVTGSGSMNPSIYPDTTLKEISFNGSLYCGHVYVYQSNEDPNFKIVHRLTYESKNGSIYFKGDNNNYMDPPIDVSQILYEVVGIDYN